MAAPPDAQVTARVDSEPTPPADPPETTADWRPQRQVRTVVSSMARSKDFGRQMKREAQRRKFFEASTKAFLGDGWPWNWSIWKAHFKAFTPILDFIHPLAYLFLTAKALHANEQDAWSQHLAWMRGCWQGEVAQVLEELRAWQEKLGTPPREAPTSDPRQIAAATRGYLENNRSRMNYPRVPSARAAGHDRLDGIAGQGNELSREGNRDVLERSRRRRGNPASPFGRPWRRRPTQPLPSPATRKTLHSSP